MKEVIMEQVIQEFRIIETDDGFRIEIKGNKEVIRRLLGFFARQWARHRHGRRPFGAGFGPRFSPFYWGPHWAGW